MYTIRYRTENGGWQKSSRPIRAEIQAIKAAQALMVRPVDPATEASVWGRHGLVYRTTEKEWR